jgi:hypothetical protein
MSISDYFADDEEDFPLAFMEVVGENVLPSTVKNAIIWASIQKFIAQEGGDLDLIDVAEFSVTEKKLSKHVVFHGPFIDVELAIESSKDRIGLVVAPRLQWKPDKFVFVAVLSN